MPLSERTIEQAIDQLKKSPGKFQRLVEDYVYLTYPDRFKGLVPQGRNSSDVTVKGWPDIYALSSSFMLNVVEVTHSPTWSTHLEEDVIKAEALGNGQLSGFVFVAWASGPSPLTTNQQKNPQFEQLVTYHERLLALGIPPDNIDFVFKKQLVRALSQPRFANIVTAILDLPGHCAPFRTISRTTEIFGTSTRYEVFAPSKEEYENHLVHRAAIIDKVEKLLNSVGWAYIRGHGAAGKTVVSIHLGLGYEARCHPAYYLDLSKTDVSLVDALDVITTHADDGVLFIIDNVHLNEAFARDCFDHWNSVGAGSHLLLIGRDTTVIDFKGTALPLDEIRAQALLLEVTQEDLEGVFLRLARRALHSSNPILRPPQEVLRTWHKLFGGDLIAFSAAVAHRLKQIGEYDWTIRAQDATRYVQQAYLGKAREAERVNLLRLAVLAQLEIDVPEEAIELAEIRPFLQNGLVHSVARGADKRYGYYRLVHPGLGDLLLTAARYSDEALQQFISEQYGYVAFKSPYASTFIAARLEIKSRVEEAASLLRSVVELENGLQQILVTRGIQSFRVNAERLARLGVLSEAEIDDRLIAVSSTLYSSALSVSLQSLPAFFEYAEAKLPRLYTSLVAMFEKPENVKDVMDSALRTPVAELAHFLKYAEEKLPNLQRSLVPVLEQPENVRRLSKLTLRTPLHFLPTFLEYAARKLPGLYAALVAALEMPDCINSLSDRALQASLGESIVFLKYAEEKLPRLYASLVAVLAQPENVKRLTDLTLQTSLHFWPAFFEYSARKLPNLYAALVAALEKPDSDKGLSDRALQAALGELAVFLAYAEGNLPTLYLSVVAVLEEPESADRLGEKALRTPLSKLTPFLRFAEGKLPVLYASLVLLFEQPESVRALTELMLRTPLHFLSEFLKHTQGKLPNVYTSLVAELEEVGAAERLSEPALQTPLGDLANFLEFAEGQLPNLYTSLVVKLEHPTSVTGLTKLTLRTPLQSLPTFFEYAERKLPKLAGFVVDILEKPESVKAVCENALQTSIGPLSGFLEYAEEKFPNLQKSLVTVLEQPENVRRLRALTLQTPLHLLPSFFEYAARRLPSLYAALVTSLETSESTNGVSERALQLALGELTYFLEYAEEKLPRLYRSVVGALEQPEGARRLRETALQTPPGELAFFLEFAEKKLPRVFASLVDAFEECAASLIESALQGSLGSLPSFLRYAEDKLPKLYASIEDALERPQSTKTVSESALRTPLGELVFFLQYAEAKLPQLYGRVVAELEQPDSAKRWSESALQTTLGELSFFFEYADGKLPVISGAITKRLTEPTTLNLLAERACRSPLDSLRHFLQTEPLGSAVVNAIDKTKWDKCRLEYVSEQLESFPAVAKTLQSLGRPELGEAPAIALLKSAKQQQWNLHTVGFHHLSYVMRLGRAAGENSIHNFLTSIVTPAWLEQIYATAPTYGIASALFGLWGYYEDALLNHFITPTLKSRVRSELKHISKMTSEKLVGALQLIGVSALVGLRAGTISTNWPNGDCVNEAIRVASPLREARVIGAVPIQLWLGLRFMAGMRADRIYVQPDEADLVLAMWKNSTGHTDKQNALNRSMIDWLECCAKSGWMLISDRQRV